MKILMGRVISKKQAGVTSLLLVLAIGLILTIMVAGISALSIREQQQARKTDLSSRALQAAEAGVKLAVAKLSVTPTYSKPGCSTVTGDTTFSVDDSLGVNASITCATVTSAFTGAYEGYLSQDRAIQVFAGPSYPGPGGAPAGPPPSYLNLQWHTLQDGVLPSPTTSILYPTVTDPDYIAAASIEMTVIYWPGTGTIGTGSIKSATIFFVPGTIDKGFSAMGGRTTPVDNKCTGTTYKCATTKAIVSSVVQNGFDLRGALGLTTDATYNSYNMVIRIKPRYSDTHFSLSFFNSVGVVVPIQSTSAQIDVTAKVDNLYRRVKAEKLIYSVAIENVLDSVVYTGKGDNDATNYNICKQMIINASDKVLVPTSPVCAF